MFASGVGRLITGRGFVAWPAVAGTLAGFLVLNCRQNACKVSPVVILYKPICRYFTCRLETIHKLKVATAPSHERKTQTSEAAAIIHGTLHNRLLYRKPTAH